MTELWTPEQPSNDVELQIIRDCIHPGFRKFANNSSADNHLDLDYNEVDTSLKAPILSGLGWLLRSAGVKLGFLAPVPNGANGWADELSSLLSPSPLVLKFEKPDEHEKRVFRNLPTTDKDVQRLLAESQRPLGVVLDDASTDGGTGEAMADHLSDQGLEIALVMSIFFRGKGVINSKYPRAVLFSRYIPRWLDWEVYNETKELKEAKKPR